MRKSKKRSSFPRRSDINRARRMGYESATRSPAAFHRVPFTHSAMRIAYVAGQWKAHRDAVHRAMRAISGIMASVAESFRKAGEAMTRGFANDTWLDRIAADRGLLRGDDDDERLRERCLHALTFEQEDAGASVTGPDATPTMIGSP